MAEYIYDVRFYTQENKHFYIYRTDIRANNKKQAMQIARELWSEKHKAFQFYLNAKRRDDITVEQGLSLPTLGRFKVLDFGAYEETVNWNYIYPLYFG